MKEDNWRGLLHHLLESATFLPVYGMSDEQKLDHKTVFTNIALENQGNIGAALGAPLLGVLGFLALGFTTVGAIGGAVVGVALGKYLGRKISKRLSTKGLTMTEFDIFVIRVKCLIKFVLILINQCKLQNEKYSKDINLQRFSVERLLTEIKPLLHYRYFDQTYQSESVKLLLKVRTLLEKVTYITTICLSYKLAKGYMKIIEKSIIYSKFSTQQIYVVLAETLQDVLTPFETLFADEKKNPIIISLVERCRKIRLRDIVIKANTLKVDQQLTIDYIKMFSNRLGQKVRVEDLERFLSVNNYRVPQIPQQTQRQSIQSSVRRRSLVEIRSYEEVEQEQFAQRPNGIVIQRKRCHSQSEIKVKSQILEQVLDQQSSTLQPHGCRQHSPIKQQSAVIVKVEEEEEQLIIPDQFHSHSGELKYSVELEAKFQLMVSLLGEPIESWDLVLKKENIVIYRTFKGDNPAVFVKGFGDLQGVKKDVLFHAIHDEAYRKKWDKLLVDFQILERESPDVDIMYYYVESPFGVANREFCQKRIVRHNFPKAGQTCLLYFSVDNKKAPYYKCHIRAETLIAGYVMESTSTGSRLHFCTNNDVKGKIPKSLVNFVASRAPVSWFQSMREACLNYDKIMAQLQKEKKK